MITAQFIHSMEAIEVNPETDLSTIRMGTGATMGNSRSPSTPGRDCSQNSL